MNPESAAEFSRNLRARPPRTIFRHQACPPDTPMDQSSLDAPQSSLRPVVKQHAHTNPPRTPARSIRAIRSGASPTRRRRRRRRRLRPRLIHFGRRCPWAERSAAFSHRCGDPQLSSSRNFFPCAIVSDRLVDSSRPPRARTVQPYRPPITASDDALVRGFAPCAPAGKTASVSVVPARHVLVGHLTGGDSFSGSSLEPPSVAQVEYRAKGDI